MSPGSEHIDTEIEDKIVELDVPIEEFMGLMGTVRLNDFISNQEKHIVPLDELDKYIEKTQKE